MTETLVEREEGFYFGMILFNKALLRNKRDEDTQVWLYVGVDPSERTRR